MSAITSNHILPSTSLCYNYLEEIATRKAQVDAGVQGVALSYLDTLVHFLFNYFLHILCPVYEQFYYEKQIEAFAKTGKELPPYVSSYLREGVLFIHRFIASPANIGSIFPSSSNLVDAMTRKVAEGITDATPRRYLDIGAGTGSFTAGIIAKMRPQDHLDVVEYDENLCKLLQRRFRHLSNVHVHPISIFDFAPNHRYDAVITGLPLNNFSSNDVQRALNKYVDLTRPGGSFCYFEYMFLPSIAQLFRRLFCCTESAQNFEQVEQAKNTLKQRFVPEIDSVYLNMTPARAIHHTVPLSN
jgi:phosphatidylethanolamine/phosphatidyl-N-methylethanolamine N-methyltransferase